MQYKHLVCVTGQNNNKYYDMREKPDGTFDATYGRIGATATTINYPMSKWDSTLNSKLRKGYEDMTELAGITEDSGEVQAHRGQEYRGPHRLSAPTGPRDSAPELYGRLREGLPGDGEQGPDDPE